MTQYAVRVYDNYSHRDLCVPEQMGTAKPNQLRGTERERLAEIAGRVCYDSLGQGRSSSDWHKHVLEVGHLSVYEHCVFTIEMPFENASFFTHLVNRPGLFMEWRKHRLLRMTMNLRTVLDWGKMSAYLGIAGNVATANFGKSLAVIAYSVAPGVVTMPDLSDSTCHVLARNMRVVWPDSDNERWATVWMRGSRRFSHELVRHGDWSAISQRSTRYVHEDESPMSPHPFNRTICDDETVLGLQADAVRAGRDAYRATFEYHESRGVNKKQARAAAADWLPHALETQVVFSASLAQWRHIKSMRVSEMADAHIREIITQACEEVGV